MSVSPSTQTELEAYAFRQLVAHLQSRPDVQNIDQMNLAGFCRNCLSKWYLRGARERGLRMNYDEALEVVYGEPYADWKKKHQSKASPEQMALFESNAHLHAQHPKMEDFPPSPAPEEREKRETRPAPPTKGAASDVCCTPADEIGVVEHSVADATPSSDRAVPRSGASKKISLRLGVLTVSDRAHAGAYADLSGPAVIETVETHFPGLLFSTLRYVVPDEEDQIAARLKQLTASGCNLVFTAGGTGVAPRDVTPEATRSVLQREIPGIAQMLVSKSLLTEPHAALSRGTAGVRDRALIVNLPGRPEACRELVAAVAPIVPHALRQIGAEDE
jgi:molybdopterin adenylyltransferase